MNNHLFEDKFVQAVYKTCVDSGIDYMEVGYKNAERLFSRDKFGCWKHCHEDDIRRIVEDNPSDLKLTAMADAEKSDYKTDILPKSEIEIVHACPQLLSDSGFSLVFRRR